MTEAQARMEILAQVREYCNVYHQPRTSFEPGMRIPYAGRVYDADEMTELVDAALDFWLTSGRRTDEFESAFGRYLGVGHVSFVNSGSSANLLAIAALTSPVLGERTLRRGDEVITIACGFPTTVAPIIQMGAVPVFVDVALPQYNVDIAQLHRALSSKTRAVMIAHTLGNPFDAQAVRDFCRDYGLWLIEDNCDSLDSRVRVDGEMRLTGTVGDIATSSFYPPHHMTCGEGGAVYTNSDKLGRIVRSLRDWGRDCRCPSGVDNCCGHRFDGQFGTLPLGYDHKYVYAHFGYNLKATDLQAAIACAQLRKLPEFTHARRRNHARLAAALEDLQDRLVLPRALQDSDPSWFGFALTCNEGISRARVVDKLERSGIQTRMLFAGNVTRHPCFDALSEAAGDYRRVGGLETTDRIMRDTFWVGVYPGMTDRRLDFMADMIRAAVMGQ